MNKFLQTIAIIGQGYVGTPLALECIKANMRVIGIEKNLEHIDNLTNGNHDLLSKDDANFLRMKIKTGQYSLLSNADSSLAAADVIVYCLPTPLDSGNNPDLSILTRAINETGPYISAGALAILESTSYPGTARMHFAEYMKRNFRNCENVDFAFSPERVDPSNEIWNLKNTPKLVGGLDLNALNRAVEFYSQIVLDVIPVDSMEIAEMAKLIENSYRLINISFVNELQEICNLLGLSLRKSLKAANTKPFGFKAFSPGPGVGGHCIPVDPLYLNWIADRAGKKSGMIEKAIEINNNLSEYIVKRFMSITQNRIGNVLISGVAYKSGVSDTRESPATKIATRLIRQNFQLHWYDSLVQSWEFGEKIKVFDETFVGVIVLQDISQELLNQALELGIPVLDCSGKYVSDVVEEL